MTALKIASLKYFAAGFVAVLTLSACGGGGGNSVGGSTAKPSMSYLELADTTIARRERVEKKYPSNFEGQNQYSDIARTVNMPQSGIANYNGEASIYVGEGVPVTYKGEVIDNAPQVLGQGTLKADFSNKTVTGKITDFVPAPGHSSTGAEARYTGEIDGNRTNGSWSGQMNFDGQTHRFNNVKELDGQFLGDNAAALDMDSEGVTTTGLEIEVDGLFEKTGK